jgi:rhodanese-related sulfurtransferase
MQKFKLFSILVLLCCFITACDKENIDSISVQEVDQLQQNLNQEYVIIDVRTPEEFEKGNVSGAQNVDVKSDSFKEQIGTYDRENKYIVYCRSGKRSAKAYGIMKELGFTNLLNMDGGYLKYQDEILKK